MEARKGGPFRVLLVIRWPVGGIRTFVRYVYGRFHPSAYRLTILAPDLPELWILKSDLSPFRPDVRPIPSQPRNADLIASVWKELGSGEYHLLHSQGITATICSALPALLRGVPHLSTIHDVFSRSQFRGSGGILRWVVLATILPLISAIHCVAFDTRTNLLEFFPTLRAFGKRIVAIPNGIEVGRFLCDQPRDLRGELVLPQDSFLIGFLGRYMSQKGFQYLVEALQILLKDESLPRKPLILSFGQEDGFIHEERARVRGRGLQDHIHFLPFVPNPAATIKGLDVLAIPSLWEACPILPMEAMVAGVPVVGTNCIGLREVLAGTPCAMIPARDSAALARELAREIRTPTKGVARAFSGEAACRFDVRRQSEALEKLMMKMIVQGTGRDRDHIRG